MAETALEDLYEIMRNGRHMRDRVSAATAASRIERTPLPGQEMPPCIGYLRHVINYQHEGGAQFSDGWRREAAVALAFFEKRIEDAAIKADGRGVLIAGSDDDAEAPPPIYRDGDRYVGLAAHMDWLQKRITARKAEEVSA